MEKGSVLHSGAGGEEGDDELMPLELRLGNGELKRGADAAELAADRADGEAQILACDGVVRQVVEAQHKT
eukprot:6180119-Pleurochrysis_carterae.AAC.3